MGKAISVALVEDQAPLTAAGLQDSSAEYRTFPDKPPISIFEETVHRVSRYAGIAALGTALVATAGLFVPV